MTDPTLLKSAMPEESNILTRVAKLEVLLNQLLSRQSAGASASDEYDDLGVMNSGEFRAGEGEPGNGFTGTRMGFPPFEYGGREWHLVGVYNDNLMVGINAETGMMLFAGGQGSLDDSGLTLEGILNAARFKAVAVDAGGTEITRYGRLEMIIPDGQTEPVLSLTFSDEPEETLYISNHNWNTGDLTGWTQSAASFEVVEDKGHTGGGQYVLHAADLATDTEETLTSPASADVVAGDKYIFEFYTWDNFKETEIPVVHNLSLDSANPTFAMGSLGAQLGEDGWCEAGYYAGNGEQVALLKFDVASYAADIVIPDEAGLVYYIRKSGLTVGTTSLKFYRMLVEWAFTEATYNKRDVTNDWTTAGAKGSGTDHEAVEFGSDAIVATDTPEGHRYTALDVALFEGWRAGTDDNYGLVAFGSPLSGNNAVDMGLAENGVGAFIMVTERPRYKVEVNWYDTAGATGNLIRTDTLATTNDVPSWNVRSMILTAPVGAVSFQAVITRGKGREFWIDDFRVRHVGVFSRLYFGPALTVQDNYGTRRVLTTIKELNNPSTAPSVGLVAYLDDAYSKVLMHLDGADTSTTFTDLSGKSWTASGNAQLDTAQKKFGSAALLLDGTDDFIYTTDHDDFNVGAGDFTIDFQIYFNSKGGYDGIYSQRTSSSSNDAITLMLDGSGQAFAFEYSYNGTAYSSVTFNTNVATGGWHHIELVRYGSTITLYIDGVAEATTFNVGANAFYNSTANVQIGKLGGGSSTQCLNGWIDEFRFTKGVARHTANFTPPTQEYAVADPGNLSVGDYYYKVSYLDQSGETMPSATSSVVTTTSTVKRVAISGIPVGPAGTTGRRIYRTTAGGSVYKFLHQINDNTTTTYEDNIADADLGANAPLTNTTANRPQFPKGGVISALSLVSNATLTITGTDVLPLVATTAANANDGDTFDGGLWMEGGTYTVSVVRRSETTAGKFDVYIDGVVVAGGPFDGYAASATNAVTTITGVVVNGSGYHTLRIKINGKHASSSDYTFGCREIVFKPASY